MVGLGSDAPDLLVRGGTVVTAAGSARADVAVVGGRIAAVEPDLGTLVGTARAEVDASGLLVLPGAVDAHTHTRIASDAEPDRFFQDSVAAAFGGTTTFLAFNNPGTGSSPEAERSVLAGIREWRAATEHDSAVDYSLSVALSGRMEDPVAGAAGDGRPGRGERQGLHGLRLPARPMPASWPPCGSWANGAACSRSIARTRS